MYISSKNTFRETSRIGLGRLTHIINNQMCKYWNVFDVFSWLRQGVWVLRGTPTGVSAIFTISYQTYILATWFLIVDAGLDHLAEVVFVRFFHCDIIHFSPFPYYPPVFLWLTLTNVVFLFLSWVIPHFLALQNASGSSSQIYFLPWF